MVVVMVVVVVVVVHFTLADDTVCMEMRGCHHHKMKII